MDPKQEFNYDKYMANFSIEGIDFYELGRTSKFTKSTLKQLGEMIMSQVEAENSKANVEEEIVADENVTATNQEPSKDTKAEEKPKTENTTKPSAEGKAKAATNTETKG